MSYQEENKPVDVNIVSANSGVLPVMGQSPKRCHYDVTFRTIVLTAGGVGSSIRPLCAADPSREYLTVQCFTNDVVLCETQSRAQDPANAIAGLPNPEGYLLWHSNTTPLRIDTTDMIWVVAQAFPAQITVMLVNRVEGT